MTDFWRDSGYHLLEPLESGRLRVTDDFLRAYFRRPEVRPVEESCAAERALHEALLKNPREAVSATRLAELADSDARENYQVVLGFRDRLVAAGTLEDCYLNAFLDEGGVRVPPLFLDQLAHAIARALLEGCKDGLRARAAELLFREQRVLLQEGAVLAADAETVEMAAATGGFGSLGRLVAEAQTPLKTVELDVLSEENAETYWQREQRFDTAIALNFAAPGLDALCRVLEAWVARFLDIQVSIQPVQQITDEKWVWHLGLDAEGSRLLNDLYEGIEVEAERMERLLSLFRLDFAEPSVMAAGLEGRPVYLALAMTEDGRLKLKPQNLLVNLPLAERA
ncbi:MAG: DUF6352 family protein [Rhodospirillales bacterium]|nr:DUF6352 family protein [Rhodospirillales bacterium]MDH3914300.1 DUF6352 family protein [Rhodospirillales bacterium]MDH3917678.1 DUF6352 family protein [Rhodospirillales bacterium]MDH3969257.1 DUF6352 family protein [Rhodospirillales bacterium]